MLKGLLLVAGVAVVCAGSATNAAAMSNWEKALVQRYTSQEKCDGRGAPAWGRASMQRYRAAQRSHRR